MLQEMIMEGFVDLKSGKDRLKGFVSSAEKRSRLMLSCARILFWSCVAIWLLVGFQVFVMNSNLMVVHHSFQPVK